MGWGFLMRYNDWAQATEQLKQQLEQVRAENAVLEKLNSWLIKQVETMQPQEIPLKETLRTMVAAGGIPENYVLPKGKCCDLERHIDTLKTELAKLKETP